MRPGKKPEILSLPHAVPIKCNQLLNQSFALNKVSYLFLLIPLQVFEQLFRQTQQAAFVKEECRRFLWLFSLSAYYDVMLRTLPES